jgi:hypothetical protein
LENYGFPKTNRVLGEAQLQKQRIERPGGEYPNLTVPVYAPYNGFRLVPGAAPILFIFYHEPEFSSGCPRHDWI